MMELSFKDAPEDIKDGAASIVRTFGFDDGMLTGAIVAAILAERLSATERAAKIAESCGDTFSNSRDMYVAVQEAAVDAKVIEIAAAIRSQP